MSGRKNSSAATDYAGEQHALQRQRLRPAERGQQAHRQRAAAEEEQVEAARRRQLQRQKQEAGHDPDPPLHRRFRLSIVTLSVA